MGAGGGLVRGVGRVLVRLGLDSSLWILVFELLSLVFAECGVRGAEFEVRSLKLGVRGSGFEV